MKVEIYSIDTNETISENTHQSVADAEKFIALIKEYGFEDTNGNRHKFSDAKVTPQGAVVYVEKE
ncbi:MAG TPA: hypothetical protein PKJ84_08210 [Anaerolineales bacterium]|nr:hypothetical protein [Anaerolineales bacterium]HNM36130.1 hypothetical protein [Anaerolineales bacterium]HNO94140.1 hypothetical protein [Anaerolineales bacterium]